MTPPRLESCYFETSGMGRWTRLARVLQTTAETHCPEWSIAIDRLRPEIDPGSTVLRGWQANTQKLGIWNQRVQAAPDGDRILLIDADTMILRPLDDVWEQAFDVAYTTKRGPFPFNAGVIFIRVSDRTRGFMAAWVAANARVLADHHPPVFWIRQFGGVNQSALAGLLADRPADISIVELPCREWNCEDSTWRKYDPGVTRIAHIKGALRRACFDPFEASVETSDLSAVWRRIEASQASTRAKVST